MHFTRLYFTVTCVACRRKKFVTLMIITLFSQLLSDTLKNWNISKQVDLAAEPTNLDLFFVDNLNLSTNRPTGAKVSRLCPTKTLFVLSAELLQKSPLPWQDPLIHAVGSALNGGHHSFFLETPSFRIRMSP